MKRQSRWTWFALLWASLLPITLVAIVLTGYGVVALVVLIGYVFLHVFFTVLVQTVLLPRARRRAGR